MKTEFPTGKAPQLVIENCQGSLTVKPHDRQVVIVSSPDANVSHDETGDVITINSQAPVSIRAPHQTALLIQNVYGTAVVKGIHNDVTIENAKGSLNCRSIGTLVVKSVYGSLSAREVDHTVTMGEVYGDVSVRNSQSVSLKQIRGDFIARNINGTVELAHSDGDIVLRNISGDVAVGYCDRDVSLRNVAGQVQASDVQGDIRLRESLPPGDHLLRAKGDIIVRWPLTAALNLQASGRTIQNHLPLVKWPIGDTAGMAISQEPATPVEVDVDVDPDLGDTAITDALKEVEQLKAAEKETLKIELGDLDDKLEEEGPALKQEHGRVYLRGRLGDGDCNLALESEADIILRGMRRVSTEDEPADEFEMDYGFVSALESFGEQMAGLGETIAAEINTKFAERMTNLSSELENELGSKYADQIAQKTENAVEKAMRKTQEALKRIQRQSVYATPPPPRPPQAPSAPQNPRQQEDKAEAQLKILEMLQNGIISPEEANTLLKALD
jgi:hypothetical protein